MFALLQCKNKGGTAEGNFMLSSLVRGGSFFILLNYVRKEDYYERNA